MALDESNEGAILVPETKHLRILQIVAGPIQTNLFLVMEKERENLFIVDAPPDSIAHAEAEIEGLGASPVGLILTHTHWDHVVDASAFKERYTIPVIAHDQARGKLEHPSHEAVAPVEIDRVVGEGDTLELGPVRFEVLHTPGHCADQISLYAPDDRVVFGGDTLFPGGYGRVDLPGASRAATVETLRRLLDLPDDVTVYPGHGMPTTIGRERPWMERVAETGQLPA